MFYNLDHFIHLPFGFFTAFSCHKFLPSVGTVVLIDPLTHSSSSRLHAESSKLQQSFSLTLFLPLCSNFSPLNSSPPHNRVFLLLPLKSCLHVTVPSVCRYPSFLALHLSRSFFFPSLPIDPAIVFCLLRAGWLALINIDNCLLSLHAKHAVFSQ